jgi:hypothetical protein
MSSLAYASTGGTFQVTTAPSLPVDTSLPSASQARPDTPPVCVNGIYTE